MAHHTIKDGYRRLVERINRFPQGAPPSRLLYRILELLFSEREAALVSRLPLRPFSVERAARVWKMPVAEARTILDELADRAILVDFEDNGHARYTLPPPMAGFFEFSLMRVRSDLDQRALSELFYQYLNEEHDFVRELFAVGDTQLGRAFINEDVLDAALAEGRTRGAANGLRSDLVVLDYERASRVIETASHIGVGVCYCRHKMHHVGRACDAPLDSICMTFNASASSLIRHGGHARQVDAAEALDLLQQARDHGLVQFGENVRERVNFICNCCGCCCEALLAAKEFCLEQTIQTTNFLPEIDRSRCDGCGKCVNACPVEAMALVSANDSARPKRRVARLDTRLCLGCGVCIPTCKKNGLSLVSRSERVITPVNTVHRTVLMAIERGKLPQLIFDNNALRSHRALAAILGAILELPPLERLMASEQMKSRYLDALMRAFP